MGAAPEGDLRVQNPNDVALPVKGIEYTMEVAGQQFASGAADASFVVPALGEAQFDTTVTTNMAGALLKLLGRDPNTLADGRRLPPRGEDLARVRLGAFSAVRRARYLQAAMSRA